MTAEIRYGNIVNAFSVWLDTYDGQKAFQEYREKVLKPTGVDYPKYETLTPDALKVLFHWVLDESNYMLNWINWYERGA